MAKMVLLMMVLLVIVGTYCLMKVMMGMTSGVGDDGSADDEFDDHGCDDHCV